MGEAAVTPRGLSCLMLHLPHKQFWFDDKAALDQFNAILALPYLKCL